MNDQNIHILFAIVPRIIIQLTEKMADLKNSEILENHDFNVQIPLRRLSNGEILNNMCVSESNGDKNGDAESDIPDLGDHYLVRRSDGTWR
jgi:hypothetical protein